MDVLLFAQNQKDEELLYNSWLHLYSGLSFEEFKRRVGYRPQTKEDNTKEQDILNNVKKIMGG